MRQRSPVLPMLALMVLCLAPARPASAIVIDVADATGLPGSLVTVPIIVSLSNESLQVQSFEVILGYDTSKLDFQEASIGDFFTDVPGVSYGFAVNPQFNEITLLLFRTSAAYPVFTNATLTKTAFNVVFTILGQSGDEIPLIPLDTATTGFNTGIGPYQQFDPGTVRVGSVTVVPEPSSLGLIALGGFALAAGLRRRRSMA